jgi:pyruvate dehydrogenase E2 component (dihydrolipoyllysine-residue acetyltransferase)
VSATTVQEVQVPDIGDFADVPIVEIMVSPGDTVAVEDPLLTLESDKASMDVPSPAAGVVKELKVSVGDTVSEGSPLLTLESTGDAPEPSSQSAVSSTQDESPQSSVLSPPSSEEDSAVRSPRSAGEASDGGAPYASPAVRRLARQLNVDLSQVKGSGRKERILKSDVEAFARGGPAPAKAAAEAVAGALNPAPWPDIDFEEFGPVERQPLSRIKRLSGPNLQRNWITIPHVTHNDEADITDLEAFRKSTNEQQAERGVKLTMVAILVRASVAALKKFPEFNSSLDGDELVLKRYYNIGFAADTPQGLVVPVIKNADSKGLLEIAEELGELSAKAREGKLGPTSMQGGTFTISSLGGIGGTSFTPIVNAPEVAILGVTRAAIKPVWRGEEFVPRLIVPLSLSYDHRVIDGAAAARFTAFLASVLTDFRRALL